MTKRPPLKTAKLSAKYVSCLTVILALSLLLGTPVSARDLLVPAGQHETTTIGQSGTSYFKLGESPLNLPVRGPGHVVGYVRMEMPGPDSPPLPGILRVNGLPSGTHKLEFEFKASSKSKWQEDRAGVPSAGRKLSLEVPAGQYHLDLASKEPLWVVLYWEPAELPAELADKVAESVSAAAQEPAPNKKSKTKKSPWDFRGAVGLSIIYNDNILTASIDDIDGFESGLYPDYYIHNTTDDLVLAPSIELEARRTFLPWGQTRARGKAKSWLYTHNSVKHNHDFDFYLRQYFGKAQSLELYLHTAPEQYIRELTDRTPLEDPDNPIERKEFRFQRNIWNLTWRQKISKKLDAKLIFEKNYRYYNRPFMENDIEAWEIRGSVSYDISRDVAMNIDYSYEDGNGRGIDMVGETLENSDNSDPSYERDLYRFELLLDPQFIKKYVDRLDLTFLYMDYYYTTDKPLVLDPYHVGRRDEFTKFTVACRRKLSKPLTVKLATRRTERITSSPWEGDLTTDKAFVQWQYWIDLTYRF